MVRRQLPGWTLLPATIAGSTIVFILDLATHGRIPAAACMIAALLLDSTLTVFLLIPLLTR